MKGIKDTRTVQDKMGQRLRQARGKMKRPELVNLLKGSSKAPIESKAEMTTERLKQWEYGNNPISLEWLPAICDVLDCDVGYLFGEYKERCRVFADIVAETGLTESAIQKLHSIKLSNPEYPLIISVLTENFNFEYILYLIYNRFLYSASEYSIQPDIRLEDGAWHLKNSIEYHKSINASETKIQFDNVILNAKKKTLLDSMISTTVISDMKDMAAAYLNRKKEGQNSG